MSRPYWMALAAFMAVGAGKAQDQEIDPDKKIIMFGPGMPTARSLRQNGREMEDQVAFDGVVIYPSTYQGGVATEAVGRPFRKDWHRIEDFEDGIADLQAAPCRRYTHNFLLAYLTTGDKQKEVPDWFDPEFEAVVNNWKVTAEYCRRGGLVGVLFDDEVYYGTNLWSYQGLKYQDTKTATEYADQAFRRGSETMRAINTVFPDIHILVLHGPSQAREVRDDAAPYGLMRAFFDGLLAECTGEACIIDGHEMAYGYRAPVTYATARRVMKETMRGLSRVPDQFDRHHQAAFSFFLGPYGTLGFSDHFASNYYTPEEFEYALHQALKYTDQYVWMYTEHCYWWEQGAEEGKLIPQAYRDALIKARQPHPHPPLLRNLDAHSAPHPGSAKPPRKLGYPVAGYPQFVGYDEQETFGDLWTDYTWQADLPHLWRFRIDPDNVGVEERWFRPEVNERAWFWITSELSWDNQGYRLYDGYGWYRQEFTPPALPEGKKVYLAFGAVAHGAEVFVNGVQAGQHNLDGWAYTPGGPWKQRFLIDVSDLLRPEAPNLIAVRVVDYGPWGGGIWKPVKLITER